LTWIKTGASDAFAGLTRYRPAPTMNGLIRNGPEATQGETMFKHILIATDGSMLSKKAVTSGIALAALHGAELIALTVVPRYPTAYFDGAMVFTPEDTARIEKQWAEAAAQTLETVAAEAGRSGVAIKTATVNSDLVGDAIIAAAEKHGADLIVMASHGRQGIKRLLLGSETQHVLTHSSLPVLVLR
jgi:nucleotide-binding universal stress UspA family protein